MINFLVKNKIVVVLAAIVCMFVYIFSWKPETGPMNFLGIPSFILFFIVVLIGLVQLKRRQFKSGLIHFILMPILLLFIFMYGLGRDFTAALGDREEDPISTSSAPSRE